MINDVVARDLHVSHGWTREFVDKLAPYYLATLTHMSRGYVTPVFQAIDEVWHAHILCTRDYADFCARNFGRFIHHERVDAVVLDAGADDFFRDYGLSRAGLAAVCAGHDIEQAMAVVDCGSEEPEQPESKRSGLAKLFSVASCSQPHEEPPKVPMVDQSRPEREQLGVMARTSPQPMPSPPRPPFGFRSAGPLKIASCTQPDLPDANPSTFARAPLGVE
jgi:hypothetical protein